MNDIPNPRGKILVIDAPFTAVGAQTRNASLSSVVTLTAPDGANTLWFSVEAQNLRMRFDAADPTATLGILWYAGQTYRLAVSAGQSIRFLEAVSGGVLNYQWGIR